MIGNVLSGAALAVTLLTFGLILWVVQRLVVEARATGSTRKRKPTHIMLVGVGTFLWGLLVVDSVSYAFLTDVLEDVLALAGSALLVAGLWKMVEFQNRVYVTLGGSGQQARSDTQGADHGEGLRRTRTENRVYFATVMVGLIFGFAQLETVLNRGRDADREQCSRMNVLRTNQAEILNSQADANRQVLARPLGTLAAFRKQIEETVRRNEAGVTKLRESVQSHPVQGQAYDVDCVAAHP